MIAFVRPDTIRLPLADGDWIEVKRRLSSGETRDLYARLYKPGPEGKLTTDPFQSGLAQVVAYLIDWSAVDEAGRPIVIRGLSVPDLERVLNMLDVESFADIREAIERHEAAMVEARTQEKKRRTGATDAAATSPSPSAAAGVLSGSAA